MWSTGVAISLFASVVAHARSSSQPFTLPHGSEPVQFITEPSITGFRWNITRHVPSAITSGYWFVAPLKQRSPLERAEGREYLPHRAGAQIYDANGDLVWSMPGERDVHSFEPVSINGSPHFAVMTGRRKDGADITKGKLETTYGLILDSEMQEVCAVAANGRDVKTNFHEFNVQPTGATAILGARFQDRDGNQSTDLDSSGFQEIDVISGNVTAQWDHVSSNVTLEESGLVEEVKKRQDAFHLNSVDKNSEGDYLVSGRHVSTIYKISGQDGSIIWRLGGKKSDFTLDEDAAFNWQHDARFRFQNETHTIISVLDNAAADLDQDLKPGIAAGKLIVLDTGTMRASLLKSFIRPGGRNSTKMGNMQLLGNDYKNSNVLINWGAPSGITEFDVEGRVVLEAFLAFGGMTSYRVFKQHYIGRPIGPPVLKVLPTRTGSRGERVATAFYVSWNGATEVHSWRFFSKCERTGEVRLLASTSKRGFETSWTMLGTIRSAYAEAIDRDGKVLGSSKTVALFEAQDYTDGPVARLGESLPSASLASVAVWALYAFALYGLCTALQRHVFALQRTRRWHDYIPISESRPHSK